MNPQTYDRWLEITFYYFSLDIVNINNNLLDLMDLIDALAPIGKYEAEPLKQTAQEVLITYTIHPTREELALLCHSAKVPITRIKQYLKIGNQKLYNLIEEDKTDPRLFFPRLNATQLLLIKKFMDTITTIRKAGIHID